MNYKRILHPLLLVGCLLLVCFGCSKNRSADSMLAEVNDSNLKRIGNLYSVYQGQHGFKGPKNEAEFKAFIVAQDPGRLKKIGVDPNQVDQLLVSERDKHPFQIRWGLVASARQGPVPLVFEKEGINGKYLVAFSSFIVKEVERSEYDQLWAGKMDDADPGNVRQ